MTHRVEIKIGSDKYQIDLHDFKNLESAHQHVKDTLLTTGIFSDVDSILEIRNAKEYDYVRVYQLSGDVPPFMLADTTAETENPAYGVTTQFSTPLTYLGQRLILSGVSYNDEETNTVYYLPVEINEQPAFDMMNEENVETLAHYYAQSCWLPGQTYKIVMPAAQLPNFKEAHEHLADYMQEVLEERHREANTPGNASAWVEWRQSDE